MCACVYHICAGVLRNQKKVSVPPGVGGGGDLPWWLGIKFDPLEEEKVFLTTESSLKIQLLFFLLFV